MKKITTNNKIADLVTRINTSKQHIKCFYSLENISILKILQEEGFIVIEGVDYKANTVLVTKKSETLKLKQISKPSRKIYRTNKDLLNTKLVNYNLGLGTYIIRTSKGIQSVRSAYEQHLGGEVLIQCFS